MLSLPTHTYWNQGIKLFSKLIISDKENESHQFSSLADKARFISLNILLADDDADDRDIFKDAFSEVFSAVNLQFAINGEKLLGLLETTDQFPDIIFLDLNMPMKNGFECLEQIRKNKKLKNIPIIIYSTTANTEQVKNTFTRGANLYWQKPSDYGSIKKMLLKILHLDFDKYLPKAERQHFMLKV